jgi:hypothetical protein
MGFALGGSFVAISQPNQQQHINTPDTPANTASDQHKPSKSFRERLSVIWDRTWEDPVAFYTFVLGIFTFFLVAVSAGQGYFLFRADKTARIAAEAAALNAKAAIGVELPIITLLRMDLMYGPGIAGFIRGVPPDTIRPTITLKNIGRTAAELVGGGITTNVHDVLPEKPTYLQFQFAAGRLLTTDNSVSIPPAEYVVSLDASEIASIEAQTKALWIYGFLTYQDFLGTAHEMRFCAKWAVVNPGGDNTWGFVLDTNTPKIYVQRT